MYLRDYDIMKLNININLFGLKIIKFLFKEYMCFYNNCSLFNMI